MITKPKELESFCNQAIKCGSIALDTEFVWQKTYFPALGLVQMALPDGTIALADPIQLPTLPGLDKVLSNPSVKLILHDATQDLQIISRCTQAQVCNVFDTRIASGFAGHLATASLASTIEHFLQIKLEKGETRSNWLQRPLTQAQLNYAVDDVIHLHKLCEKLRQSARQLGNEQAMDEEMNRFNDPATYAETSSTALFNRFKTNRWPPSQQTWLYALLDWRETAARNLNRPRRHIIQDATLVEIARACHNSPSGQPPINWPPTVPRKLTNKIESAWHEITQAKPTDQFIASISGPVNPPSTKLKQIIEHRRKHLAATAKQKGIDPSLIGNKADITAWTLSGISEDSSADDATSISGWRQPFYQAAARAYPIAPDEQSANSPSGQRLLDL